MPGTRLWTGDSADRHEAWPSRHATPVKWRPRNRLWPTRNVAVLPRNVAVCPETSPSALRAGVGPADIGIPRPGKSRAQLSAYLDEGIQAIFCLLNQVIVGFRVRRWRAFAITDGRTHHHMAAVGIGSFVKRNFSVRLLNRAADGPQAPWTIAGTRCAPGGAS